MNGPEVVNKAARYVPNPHVRELFNSATSNIGCHGKNFYLREEFNVNDHIDARSAPSSSPQPSNQDLSNSVSEEDNDPDPPMGQENQEGNVSRFLMTSFYFYT